VIYPPVDLDRFTPVREGADYYLVVSALVPYKRVDLAVLAATRSRRRLVVVGSGPEEARLRALAGPSVSFLGWRSDAEVAQLYARCRAVLFPSVEDFGIVPLEAAAAGRPTIALARGGALETMVGLDAGGPPTAVFFETQTVEAVTDAMATFEAATHRFEPAALRAHAARFDRPRFAREMREWILGRWAEVAARAC
jgi:glycosyltransferase involved in cell wall biosynthesis